MSLIGIDFGDTSCKLAVRESDGLRLISDRMPRNMMRDGDVASPETMSSFLRSVRKEHQVRKKDCVLVLSGSQIYFRNISLPPMTTTELVLNLPYEFRDFIQDDPDGYLFDYAVDNIERRDDGSVERMNLYASAVPRELVVTYADVLRKAGFRLAAAVPSQMAYMRLLKSRFGGHADAADAAEAVLPEGSDVVLVDIGHENVIISLFRDLRYDSARTIDFGCGELDNIIADMRGIDPYTAASYKYTNHEGVLDEPECMALCDRFAVEVSKVVNFYNFSNPEREVGMLYFLGGGASIPQLTRAISEAVTVPFAPIEELLPEEARGQEGSFACALAVAGLLEGEAM